MIVRAFDPATDAPGFAAIYAASFPDAERLPLGLLLGGVGGRRLQVACDDHGRVIGLTCIIPAAGTIFLEYLAVDPDVRSGGTGGALLAAVVADAGEQDVLAELEPTDGSPDAGRRAAFYRRHGFEPAPWQGGYGMPDVTGGFLELELWHRAGHGRPESPAELLRDLYPRVYGDAGRAHLPRVLAGIR